MEKGSAHMEKEKKIVFLIKVMCGGGAERVISILSSALVKRGFDVTLIITHQKMDEANLRDISEEIQVISLEDQIEGMSRKPLGASLRMLYARLLGKISRVFQGKNSDISLIQKYYARNYVKVSWLKEFFKKHRKSTVIAFLYDSIFLSMLSISRENKVIISERGDPEQSIASKTTMAFLHSMFPKADHVVFQSPDVQKWYETSMGVKGQVIFNPVKANLPERYLGERQKKIVNFCRISEQKNLELLIEAFLKLHEDYPEYELYIYGDAVGNGAEGYLEKIRDIIEKKDVDRRIHLLGGCSDIHEKIRDYAMFVSSSDFEGMSNSMLEAMAIGLPVVCTDCPAGGARAVIRDHENGILVPVRDAESMYQAMREVIEHPELANHLSQNAVCIREEQSLENIIEKWMEIIHD